MCGETMRFDCRLITVKFEQNKPAWVFNLLNQIEPDDPWFFSTVTRILNGFGQKLFDAIGLYMNMNQKSNHGAGLNPWHQLASFISISGKFPERD